MKKRITVLSLLFCLLFILSSCKEDDRTFHINEYATTDPPKESLTILPSREPGSTSSSSETPVLPGSDESAVSNPSTSSWQSNYTLTYAFTENGERSELTETRCDGLYSAKDLASGTISYFRQEGENIDSYVLNPSAMTGNHAIIEGKNLQDITTGFMKIAYLDPGFSMFSNVEYQGTESVAGRPAAKYTQSAYDSTGLLTAYAFVWVDSEYGFASKCMVYNLSGAVNTSWELLSLEVGGVSLDSAAISTEGYELQEVTGNE